MSQWDDQDGRYWFDERAADRACEWFERYLVLFEGEWAGKSFELFDMQKDILRNVYGWKRTDDNTRRCRIAYVWIPRKNTKSTFAAGVGTLMLFGDGEPGAQVYCIAATEDQAKIVFNFTQNFVAGSDELRKRCTLFKDSIWLDEIKGRMQALTGKPQGKHGLNASGIIGDEIHEWPTDELTHMYTNRKAPAANRLTS
jgi:phage terminase large subunit-like protein